MIRSLVSIREKGFTLVELLTVIFIISILASIVLVSVNSARVKSRDSKRKNDVETVSQALEIYYAQKKVYPCASCTTFSNSNWEILKNSDEFYPKYISSWPTDPKSGAGYIYTVDGTAKKYAVDAQLEKSPADTVAGSCNPSETTFWQSGSFECGDETIHYRRVGR